MENQVEQPTEKQKSISDIEKEFKQGLLNEDIQATNQEPPLSNTVAHVQKESLPIEFVRPLVAVKNGFLSSKFSQGLDEKAKEAVNEYCKPTEPEVLAYRTVADYLIERFAPDLLNGVNAPLWLAGATILQVELTRIAFLFENKKINSKE